MGNNGRVRDHGLYSQAEVEMGLQQCMHPARRLAATIRAVISSPQRDHRDQPRFLKSSSTGIRRSRYTFQRTGKGGWNRRFYAGELPGVWPQIQCSEQLQ